MSDVGWTLPESAATEKAKTEAVFIQEYALWLQLPANRDTLPLKGGLGNEGFCKNEPALVAGLICSKGKIMRGMVYAKTFQQVYDIDFAEASSEGRLMRKMLFRLKKYSLKSGTRSAAVERLGQHLCHDPEEPDEEHEEIDEQDGDELERSLEQRIKRLRVQLAPSEPVVIDSEDTDDDGDLPKAAVADGALEPEPLAAASSVLAASTAASSVLAASEASSALAASAEASSELAVSGAASSVPWDIHSEKLGLTRRSEVTGKAYIRNRSAEGD